MLRAIETSVILAKELNIEYEVVDALREYDCGIAEGRSDEEAWQMMQEYFGAWLKGEKLDQGIEGGETFYDIRDRFVPFINNLIQQCQDTDHNLLCVGHGGLYWMMLPEVLKNIDVAFISSHDGFDYSTPIVSELGPEGLVCREWNGVPFKM